MFDSKTIRQVLIYLSGFFALEIFSYFALFLYNLNYLIFIFLALACLALSIYRLEYGLLFVFGELFIGSMGHLFMVSLGDYQLSIRMALWLTVILVFFLKFIRQLISRGQESKYLLILKKFSYRKYFLCFAFFIAVGLISAFFRGRAFNLIFADFNAWLYWFLLLPAIVVYGQKDAGVWKNLKIIFISAAIYLSIKTLFLLFIFTHNLSFASEAYFWLRRTLVGEMTPTLSGWPRIFIQGQIFSGVAFFLVFWSSLKNFKNIKVLILAAFLASALLISFSRSFWVALCGAIIFSLFIIWRFYSGRKALLAATWFALSLLLGFSMIYFVAIFPYPIPGKFNADFLSRVSNNNEAALASRWALLPVLTKEIKKEPFLGQGYGATITYFSKDPRVLEKNPTGEYTTYAFEWGYLDLWLKIGLLGLLVYLGLIGQLIKTALSIGRKDKNLLALGLSAGIVFLALTNIFTPYLNHPLGIGILLIGACLIKPDGVY